MANIFEGLNTEDREEMIKQMTEKVISHWSEIDQKANELFEDEDYVLWLEQFTNEHANFADDTWLYYPDGISKYDRKNVENLYLFYNAIDNYANKNSLSPNVCEFGNFYLICFNDIGYEIGMLVGQGTLFFCSRVNIENKENFIEFDVIQKYIKNKQKNLKIK